ncbi:HEAT repeat protein [Ophiocordyceps sinensis CO18]|nr:HEAT repeat protein [Ophiocordyceps sinensis CO18]
MSVVIPTLMARATGEGQEAYGETSARLLELAAVDQGAFRAIVGAMSGGQRAFLEDVIRSGRHAANGADKASADVSQQPSITLKMDFGG